MASTLDEPPSAEASRSPRDASNDPDGPPVTRPWARPPEDVTAALEVEVGRGLSDDEVARRRQAWGTNEVPRQEGRSNLDILVAQFVDPIMAVLGAAGVAAALAGEVVEALAIVVAVVVNAAIGFVTELRAKASVESLAELGRTQSTVRRASRLHTVDSADLVPGDVVVLEEGDVLPADARLVEIANLSVDEAPLTGESEPVRKGVEAVDDETVLAERTSMAWKGTRITTGSGEGVVTATGTGTQIGEVSTMVEDSSGDDKTPLEHQLDRLGRALIVAVVVVGVVVAAGGIAVGQPVQEMVEVAIALAIAAVPEGLAVVATLALARGVVRMSRRNALVKRLASVETLGSASVIFTDKTGTLTKGDMAATVLQTRPGHRIEIDDVTTELPEPVRTALLVGSLCGNAELADDTTHDHDEDDVGDPMEVALQRASVRAGLGGRSEQLRWLPEVREVAFDRATRMMATFHRLPEDVDARNRLAGDREGSLLVAVKGAPGAVIGACTRLADGTDLDDADREKLLGTQRELARDGLRVLALARRVVDDAEAEPYEDLELLGIVGLLDPPRDATADAIAACHRAGVDVVMVTGDQPATAHAIARRIGLVSDHDDAVLKGSDVPPVEEWDDEVQERLLATRVFARLDPRQKLDLVSLAQDRGRVVGMTGDGVNDAPALKRADIGIAMGQKGTQVARDASDIVLQDDAFETIVEAIREGRTIFSNIVRFVVYLLSGNLGEILAVSAAALAGGALPLLPLQILFINLANDVFPASALGVVRGDDTVLDAEPRDPGTPIMTRQRWLETAGWAVLVGGVTLGLFALCLGPLGLGEAEASTVSFMTFVVARLAHTFNMRNPREPVFTNTIVKSRAVWAALAASSALLLVGVYWTPLANVLGVVTPTAQTWGLALGGGLAVLVLGQLALQVARLRAR